MKTKTGMKICQQKAIKKNKDEIHPCFLNLTKLSMKKLC